jgi:hypothetical protein
MPLPISIPGWSYVTRVFGWLNRKVRAVLAMFWRGCCAIGRYLRSVLDRALVYLFPFFLLFLEIILRDAFKVNARDFIGPTLAATGVGLVIPLTGHKSTKLNQSLPGIDKKLLGKLQELQAQGFTIEPKSLRTFRSACWVIAFLLIAAWIWTVTQSLNADAPLWGPFPDHYYVGMASFVLGLLMSEVKESL